MSSRKICTQCGAEFGAEQKFCPNDGSPLRDAQAADPLIGQVIADRYHVTGLLGEGGMGRVYVAEHVRMGRKSALKVMSPALAAAADAITRFNREAANASRINHPNVAAIYDFGETSDGLLYIAMEFVEGETLHALVQRAGPLPAARAAQIARGAADALAAAHHLGIIHRDLKPDNIMLARQLDGSDWVKVVDFGIAKSVAAAGQSGGGGQTVTTAGVSLGTPEYMSPEQLAGEKLDARTDIYSLGLVLFHMLTGELPYPKLTSKETLVRRLTSPPATLADVRPDVSWPPAIQAVLTRALDPEPSRRFDTVAEFGRAIVDAAAQGSAGDLERTVRLSSMQPAVAAPALAPTGVHQAAPAAAPPVPLARPSATRKLPEPKRPGRGRAAGTALVVLLLAVAGYLGLRARRQATGAVASLPAPADTTPPRAAAPESSHAATDTAGARPRETPRVAVAAPKQSTAAVAAPASGNTAAPVDSTRGQEVEAALREIRSRLVSAGRAVALGQTVVANRDLRAGQEGIRAIRERFPNGTMPPALTRQLREIGGAALRACYAEAGPDQGGLQRCRLLQQREARARGARPGA